MPTITELSAEPLDIELTEPFGIATGEQAVARNLLVRVTLDDGSVGLGEAAPFPAVNGETREQALESFRAVRSLVVGEEAERWREIARAITEAGALPSARCGIESAVLDAGCRHRGEPLWRHFGGAATELTTDLTITTGPPEVVGRAARRAALQGFEVLKVKTGGVPLETDVQRLEAILAAAPGARLILDSNASQTADEAVELIAALGRGVERIALFEQPTRADDLDGLRRVGEQSGVSVAADESARSVSDVERIAGERAATVVNIKVTKTGVAEAIDMIAATERAGLGLMIGGMVESKLTMGLSACLAAGRGGFDFVDLDTPLFMKSSPVRGSYEQEGPRMRLETIAAGHGAYVSSAHRSAKKEVT